MLIVLVGAPGAGKSTVGRLLAERLGVAFRDTDADIEHRAGKTIADIFVDEGEHAFRGLEREAVRAALDEHDGVLALGGGAVVDAANRRLLNGRTVVHLAVSHAAAIKRVGLATARPLLVDNPRATLRRLLDERRPLYEEVATVTVPTDDTSPEAVVDGVVAALALPTVSS